MARASIFKPEYSLRIQNISKSFPGVKALDSITLDLRRGEVHAVIGENGAGKSTLMKILAGAFEPEEGTLYINSKQIHTYSPKEAQKNGIAIICQEFNLIQNLTVAENICLGHEPGNLGWISKKEELKIAQAIFKELEENIPVKSPISRLSMAQQQLVEIAKALSLKTNILIMDEPASALSLTEREHLFALIRRLRKREITILYVSHNLDEVFKISDAVTVLKDGKLVCSKKTNELTEEELITAMVGRRIEYIFPKKNGNYGNPILHVKHLSSLPEIKDVSFQLRSGEILGLYGIVGSGRTELCKTLFGVRPFEGEIILADAVLTGHDPGTAVERGLALLTEDRKSEGLIMGQSIRKNMALPSLKKRQNFGIVNDRREKSGVRDLVEILKIKTPSIEKDVYSLSGGNQQKVVIGKWLLSKPKVLICDEPTRGVDIGAKLEIYAYLRNLADEGLAIIMVSSELPEILGMSDRILVMRQGRITAEFDGREATEENVLAQAIGTGLRSPGSLDSPGSLKPSNGPDDTLPLIQRLALLSDKVVYIFLALLAAAGIISSSKFLNGYNLTSIIRYAAALGIVSMGQSFVMIAGGVDLSISSVITLTTVISASIILSQDAMILPAVASVVGVGVLIGVINGFSIVKLKIPPFIATLGVMSIGKGTVLLITRGPIGSISRTFGLFSRGSIGPVPSALLLSSFVFAIASFIMEKTRYGKHLFAIGGNREAARLAGIHVKWLEFSAYIVSSLCAVTAGLYLTSRMGVGDPTVGPGFELDSIIAVLIGGIPFGGGKGTIPGVIAGVLLLSVLGNLLTLWNLHSWYHQITRALILLATIALFKRYSG
ncbi:MAG: ATP-binding cassette domain-containing protein [Spirochaetota bacterium]